MAESLPVDLSARIDLSSLDDEELEWLNRVVLAAEETVREQPDYPWLALYELVDLRSDIACEKAIRRLR